MMEDSDMKMDRDSTTDALLSINSLKYTLPEQLSVVTQRTMQKYPSLSREHKGGSSTIYFRLETGARYIDGRNSWVRLRLTSTESASFGSGSVANCIRTVVIRSASGTELDRVQHYNYHNRNAKRWSCPPDYFTKTGTLQGWDDANIDLITPNYWYIRLADLSGFFDNSKLIPSMVASGLQIELEMESPQTSLEWETTLGGYTMDDCEVFCDTFLLSDSISRKMNQLAASGGLELSYVATAATFTTGGDSVNRFSINANLSVSRALHVIAVEVPAIFLTAGSDSFQCGQGNRLASWQYRVGSLYFPQAPVEGTRDSYIQTLHSFDKLRNCHQGASTDVSLINFEGYGSPTIAQRNNAMVGMTLERSSVLSLSGVPINQSRALVLDISYADQVARIIYQFVSYQKACTVFLSNQVVKE